MLFYSLLIGYPELGLPVFDPLQLQKLDIEQGANLNTFWYLFLIKLFSGGTSPVNLKIHLRNFQLLGLSGVKFHTIKGFGKDYHNQKMELKFHIPTWQIFGPYKVI